MRTPRYQIHVERLIVHGIDAAQIDPVELRDAVAVAVARELEGIDLPTGRSMTATVRIDSGPLPSTGPALAGAIGRGVARGVGRGGRYG